MQARHAGMQALPRYQGSVSSAVLQCKSCKYQSIKKEVFSCIEVPVSERGVASLENCLERWLVALEVQDCKCTSCSQCGSGVKKLYTRSACRITDHPVKEDSKS